MDDETEKPIRGLKGAEIDQYNLLLPLLNSLLLEMKQLSSKKQDLQLNKLKIRKINEILAKTKELLKSEPTGNFLELLDEALIPTNSDAVLIMSQHQTAMNTFQRKYKRPWQGGFSSVWLSEEIADELRESRSGIDEADDEVEEDETELEDE